MKKFLLALLVAILAAGVFAFTACAQDSGKYSPQSGDSFISFDASKVIAGTVDGAPSSTITKNVTFEGMNAVKVVPNVADGGKNAIILDCFTLASYDPKITVPDYKYVGVTYYYDTDKPSFTKKPFFRILPGNTGATADLKVYAADDIVTNKWTEAYFSFASIMELKKPDKPYINQVHFKPFGDTASSILSEDDVIYVAKYTFYKENPNPNAKAVVSFDKSSPGASGEMDSITVKDGEEVTLPECTFTYEGATFRGWRQRATNTIFKAGDKITPAEGESVFYAEWDETGELSDFVSLDFTKYANGVVNHTGAAEVINDSEKDGRPAVKIIPNPSCDKAKRISIDGWSYGSANVDLKVYKYFAVEYFFETDKQIDATMNLTIMNTGGLFTGSAEANASEPVKTNQWHTVYFDFSHINLKPELSAHIMKQMHMRILGEYPLSELSENDVMYISRVMFYKELPNTEEHTSYMNGYDDGTFRPGGTMTRAEACTVIARLLESEDKISGAASFTDVASTDWFAKYVGFCEAKGLLKSYSGTFLPNQAITRAEFAELVYLTGLAKNIGKETAFTDVTESHPKYASIKAASGAGLINGYDNGNNTFAFRPDNTITRAEVVTVINRARGRSRTLDNINSEIVLLFLDTDRTHWAFADIAEATLPHVESNSSWLYPLEDPIKLLGDRFDIKAYYNVEGGNAKVAELDALEKKRIEEIRNTPSMDLSHIKGKKLYVSSSLGNDLNDGLSPEKPLKTLGAAYRLCTSGDAVLLRRGDIWREPMTARHGVTYTAYGEGEKPAIYGSPENGADPEKWLLVYSDDSGKKVWQYKNVNMKDIGTMVIREGDREYYTAKVMAYCVNDKYVYKDDKTKDFDYIAELKNDLEFFHYANNALSGNVINAGTAQGPVFLRCDSGNPGKIFDSIEFNARTNGIAISGNNITIDNIKVMYVGCHGISAGTTSNLTVTNCEFGWIGGSIQSYNANGNTDGSPTRFGNGVEIYGGCDGYIVDNCYLWQCYDAGVTHQYSSRSGGNCIMKNITYSNNLITDCIYSIEYFLSNNSDGLDRYGDNVLYENNLCRRAGFGFGGWLGRAHRGAAEHIRSGGGSTNNPFTNYRIINNIFDRSTYELCQTTTNWDNCKPIYSGNTFIQGIGNEFYTYGKEIGKADLTARTTMVNVLGDKTGTFYYVETMPKNKFDFVPTKKAEPVEADKTRFAPFFDLDARLEEELANGEILEPLLVRTYKDKNLYADTRSAYTVSDGLDSATGIAYADIDVKNESTLLNMDCYNLPKVDVSSGTVVLKVLMRTNQKVKPQSFCYSVFAADGTKIGNGGTGMSVVETKGDGSWEEVYITVSGYKEGSSYSTQFHVCFGGTARGNSYYKDGKLIGDPYFNVAAWGIFPNLASAKAYDLTEAAKNGVKK